MGNKTSSEVNTMIKNKVVNSLDLNMYCETINETAVETANNVFTSHSASADVSNEFKTGKISVSGKDSKADLSLSNKGTVQMNSQIITEIVNNVSNTISSQMTADITQMIDNELLNKLTEEMNQNIKNGMLSTAFGNENSNKQNTNIENDIQNNTNLSFSNIVKNITNYNMNNNIENKCLASYKSKNKVDADGIEITEGGELKFNLSNNIDVSLDCISNTQLINNIASDLCNLADIKIIDEKKTKSSNEADIKNSQDVENGGLGEAVASAAEGVGEGAGSIINSAGNAVSGIFSSTTKIFLIIGLVVCCVVIIAIVAIGYILTDEQGSKTVQGLASTATQVVGPSGKLNMAKNLVSNPSSGGKICIFNDNFNNTHLLFKNFIKNII